MEPIPDFNEIDLVKYKPSPLIENGHVGKEYSPRAWNKRMPVMEICAFFYDKLDKFRTTFQENKKIIYHNFDDNSRKEVDWSKEESHNEKMEGENADGNITELVYRSNFTKSSKSNSNTVHIFIPGGYWISMRRYTYRSIGHFIEQSNQANITATIGYDICPNNTVEKSVIICAQGIEKVIIESYNILGENNLENPINFALAGHCAGAHLIVMAISHMMKNPEEFPNFIKYQKDFCHFNMLSGVYDCRPIIHTVTNGLGLNWTPEQAYLCSPIHPIAFNDFMSHLKLVEENTKPNTKQGNSSSVNFFVGEVESDEFKRQTKEYYQAIDKRFGQGLIKVQHEILEDKDHFSMIEQFFENEDYTLVKEYLTQV